MSDIKVSIKEIKTVIEPSKYDMALLSAIHWLGDRYLIARPINKRDRKPKRYEFKKI